MGPAVEAGFMLTDGSLGSRYATASKAKPEKDGPKRLSHGVLREAALAGARVNLTVSLRDTASLVLP